MGKLSEQRISSCAPAKVEAGEYSANQLRDAHKIVCTKGCQASTEPSKIQQSRVVPALGRPLKTEPVLILSRAARAWSERNIWRQASAALARHSCGNIMLSMLQYEAEPFLSRYARRCCRTEILRFAGLVASVAYCPVQDSLDRASPRGWDLVSTT